MALTVASTRMTLAEAQRAEGWDPGSLGELQKNYSIIDTIPWYPTTHGLMNRQVQADRLPAGAFSMINGAIPTGSGGKSVIEEPVKLFQMESQVDERLFQGVTPEQARAIRDSEDEMAMEGVLSGFEGAIINGNDGSAPDSLRGWEARRPALATGLCIGCGATGSGTLESAYMVQVGRKGFHFAYPSNSGRPGIKTTDKGLQRVASPDGTGDFYAWCRLIEVWGAMVLRDNRSLIRFANIDSTSATNTLTADRIITGRNQLPGMGTDAFVFVSRNVKTQLDQAAYNKTNLAITIGQLDGYGAVTMVGGVPVKLSEAILDDESTVS